MPLASLLESDFIDVGRGAGNSISRTLGSPQHCEIRVQQDVRLSRANARSTSERISASRARSVSSYDKVPSTVAELTSGWIGHALVQARVLADAAELLGIQVAPVAAPGYINDTVRVSLQLAPTSLGPASVIVKLPHTNSAHLETAIENNLYEAEYQFYNEIWATLKKAQVPMAECLHAAVDTQRELWVLLLEDLTLRGPSWHGGDQVAGISKAEMAAGCISLARMHAAFWDGHQQLPDWLPTTNEIQIVSVVNAVDHYWEAYKTCKWPKLANVSAEAMGVAQVRAGRFRGLPCLRQTVSHPFSLQVVLSWCAAPMAIESLDKRTHLVCSLLVLTCQLVATNVEKLAAMLEQPPLTLVHHDARPDNLFFGPAEDGSCVEAAILDWQEIGRGKERA